MYVLEFKEKPFGYKQNRRIICYDIVKRDFWALTWVTNWGFNNVAVLEQ